MIVWLTSSHDITDEPRHQGYAAQTAGVVCTARLRSFLAFRSPTVHQTPVGRRGPASSFPVQFTDMNKANCKAWFAGVGNRMPDEWRALLRLHPRAYNLLNDLLSDTGEAHPAPFSREQRFVLQRDHTTDIVQEQVLPEEVYTGEILVDDLYRTVRQARLPFRRCPWCKTIFIRVKRQKYCSPTCTARGTEADRKGTRKEYQRKYMRTKRQKARREQRGSLRG